MKHAVVFGGYGTFGSHVVRELARLGVRVVVAGRDRGKAQALAGALGPGHGWVVADVCDPKSCRAILSAETVAVNCAGPFRHFGPVLLDACLEAGCPYADIADDRAYTATVRSYEGRFRERGLTAVPGCSSVPGISGALALAAREALGTAPERVQVTLFIGNRNPKGGAAVRSMMEGLGRPIQAPQGTLYGYRDGETVCLPEPFGRRRVYNFDSPEYDLFPPLLGARSVTVKLGFELRTVTWGLATLAWLGTGYGPRTIAFFEWLGSWFQSVGTSGGAVMAELFAQDRVSRCAIVGAADGQRMAALPCAYAAEALCRGGSHPGVTTAYELLGWRVLLDRLVADGFRLDLQTAP